MGTNFYFRMDNRDKIKTAVDAFDYDLARSLMEETEIHIGKRSCGWLPLFQQQPGKYNSISEMKKFYDENELVIISEYDEEFTWEQLENELINWNGGYDGAIHKRYLDQSGVPDYLRDYNMPDYTPVSHFDYANGRYSNEYYKDDQGYEFTYHEFS